jgi:chromosome segregation ATPase
MTNRHQLLVDSFEKKLRKLLQLYAQEKDKNHKLEEELEQKKEEVMQAHKIILDLRSDYEDIKMVQILSGSSADREAAHRRISHLVREIDKCIDLLNQ